MALTKSPTPRVGVLLRQWRERRRISQLDLALRADSSARHISFVETGRSRPSRAMVLKLAEHLDVPVRERNALLLAAGYAPEYPETPFGDPAMGALRQGVERLLRAHEPYPALVVNAVHDVVAANGAVMRLLEGVAEHLMEPPLSAVRLALHPDGLAPRIVNYKQWREHLIERLERSLAVHGSEPLLRLLEEVRAYPSPEGAEDGGAEPVDSPFALPMRIRAGGRELAFISTIATFNTPLDITVSELAIETFLPADPETARILHGGNS